MSPGELIVADSREVKEALQAGDLDDPARLVGQGRFEREDAATGVSVARGDGNRAQAGGVDEPERGEVEPQLDPWLELLGERALELRSRANIECSDDSYADDLAFPREYMNRERLWLEQIHFGALGH